MSFLGRSLKFPIELDGRGGLKTVEEEAAVENNLKAIIVTMIGEHAFNPKLGSPIEPFIPVQDADVIAELTKDAIADWEDRIVENTLQVSADIGDEGELIIIVIYQIRGEATLRTLNYQYRRFSE